MSALARTMRPTSRLRGCKSLSRIGAQYDVSLIDCTAPALWSSSLTKPGIQKRCFGGGARTRTLLQLHGDRTRQRSHSRQQHLGGQQKAGSLFGTSAHRTSSTLVVAPEVSEAVAAGEPVVALESTIYTHGAIGSDLDLPSVVRKHGAVPAVVGIVDGIAKVGVSDAELARMVAGNPVKVSRRDVARLVGMGMTGTKQHGGTTVAATMLLARLAGIRVFGTGGLGGVHRGYERYMDVSADLTELARTRVAVVSSGCKGFLDIPRTLEYLETAGVGVATFADGRKDEDVSFPAFWVRDSGIPSPSVVHDEGEAAAMILAQESLGIESGILFANPIPEEYAIPAAEIDEAIEMAVREAEQKGFSGNRNTPFILAKIRELTGGRSVPANKALVEANVARAARIAVEVSRMLSRNDGSTAARVFVQNQASAPSPPSSDDVVRIERSPKPHILVAGSVAVDLTCDYTCDSASGNLQGKMPALQTSNPAVISQSIGGVGRNVALAARLVTDSNEVKLCSMVGDDIAGETVMAALEASGLDTSFVRKLGHEYASGRTAQYVAVNDADKNLMLAMADMAIFSTHSFPAYWKSAVAAMRPDWLVVDANWSDEAIQSWTSAGRENKAKIAFEPVSTAKAARLFPPQRKGSHGATRPFPHCAVDLATPNQLELAAMFEAASTRGYLEDPAWFAVVDKFGIRGARERFVKMTSTELTDAGVPVQSVQLLPYIPTIVTKLGADGALLTKLLLKGDPLLSDPAAKPYILSRSAHEDSPIGGIYMRLYPCVEAVKDPVSVNGIGDTFLGVLVAGLSQGGRIEELIDVAQKAAVMTLRSKESVSWELGSLQSELSRRCSK